VLQIVLAVLLTTHLLLVDVAMAGPLVAAWIEWRAGRRAEPQSDRLARRLAGLSLWALAGGSALGGVLLAIRYLADDRAYFAALGAIPTERLWFALAELVFSFVCLGAYVALWNRWRDHRVLHRLLALAGTSNLLVHFPALFAVISVVSTRPELVATSVDRAGYRRLLIDGEVLSRVIHVWLAAAAVTGIVVMVLAMRTSDTAMSLAIRERHLKGGGRLALAATLLQFPAGVWLVLEMPESVRGPLLGSDWLATGLFLVSLLLSVHLLHLLAAVSLGDLKAKQATRALAAVTVLVLLMVGTRLRLDAQAESVAPAAAATLPNGRVMPGALRLKRSAFDSAHWHCPCVGLGFRFNRGKSAGAPCRVG
jgi:hypothetical protein